MHNNSIISSDLPYCAYIGNDSTDRQPKTEEGHSVVHMSKLLRSSSAVESADIKLISLAAAAHPDVLNGQPLLLVDDQGNTVMALEPGTPWLWHEDPEQLSHSGRHAAVVHFTDGRYSALVDGKFIPIEGEETFYKALLTAVRQCGPHIVTDSEGARLRHTLAMFMETEADRLGTLWFDKQRRQPEWKITAHSDPENDQSSHSLVEQCHEMLDARGTFTFIPRITNKGKLLGSISCWINRSPFLVNSDAILVNGPVHHTVIENSPHLLSPMQNGKIAVGFEEAINGKSSLHDGALPLVASTAAAVAVKHSARSKTTRMAMAGLGLTGFLFAGKELLSWYQRSNKHTDMASGEQHMGASPVLSQRYYSSPAAIQLENTDDDFSISGGHPTSSMSDEEKITYRLTLSTPEKIFSSTARTTTRHETDDLNIEQFDVPCADKGLQRTIADVLRQIGDTVSYPVTELAKAAQVLVYYERYKQCPSEKDIEKLEFMATGIDTFISSFLSFLPGGSPLSLVQNIGGPLFKLFADALDGKELEINNVDALNDQLLFLARTTWHFTPRERNGDVKQEKITLPENTVFKKNKLSAMINHDFFNLHSEGEHYIGRSAHSTRDVTYSPSQGMWLFRNKNAYFYEEEYHKNMVSDYSVDHDYIQKMKQYSDTNQGVSIDNRNNLMQVLKNDNTYARFVLMNNGGEGGNIEADFYKINGIDYGYAKKSGLENRVLRFNRGEFFFEARSTKVRESLVKFIDNHVTRHTASDDFHISTIMKDGFSYDSNNQKYLKYNNGYYKVDTDDNNCEYITSLQDDNPKRVYIKRNEESFFDVDFGFTWKKIERYFMKTTEGYFIQNDVSNAIIENCVSYDGVANYNSDKGILRDDNLDFYLSLNGVLYELFEYGDDFITIKSKRQNVDDITLFMANDYFFERESNNQFEEKAAIDMQSFSCKIKRAPATASCNDVFVSQRVDTLLRDKAKNCIVELGTSEDQLRLASQFPNLFFDAQNKKLYFKYHGGFYRAALTNGLNLNVLKQTTLYIYHKGILGGRNNVVSLVYDKIDRKTIIQTQEEKLQWGAKMTPKEVVDFVRDNDFLKITNFGKLDDVVADINRKGSIKFISLSNSYSNGDMREWVKSALNYQNDNFEIYSISDVSDKEPFYVRGGALLIKKSIEHAGMQIDMAIRELNNHTPNAQKYLGYVLGVNNKGAIQSFSTRLAKQLSEIKLKINEDNIKLVSSRRDVIPGDHFERDAVRDTDTLLNPPVHENYYYKPTLTEKSRRLGVYAFVPLNTSRNIYVCLDRLYFIDPTHPDVSLRKSHFLDAMETIIHEATHSAGVDPDITYISVDEGKLAPVLDAIDEYTESIVKDELNDKPTFIKIRKEYMKLHPEYSIVTDTMRDDKNSLHYLFSYDVGFKANVLLHTPDFLAIFARDLAANSAVKFRAR